MKIPVLAEGARPAKGGTQYWTRDAHMLRSAVISADDRYRYALGRRWRRKVDGDQIAWVLLNPSTADALIDDPTVRRCMGFSRAWGYNAMVLVNLFGFRATHPNELILEHDPVGPYNVAYVKLAIANATSVVVGWGGNPHDRSPIDLRREEYHQGKPVYCLGRTNKGRPRHPLYLPRETQRERY